jgi:outer membrane protein assembly factor BamD (BamD/ComL family)
MNRWSMRWLLVAAVLVAFTYESPAPLIYKPGEGWYYEPVGAKGDWMKTRAKDQLEVAKAAFDKKDYSLAMRAARRTVSQWPLSDYAPDAQYMIGRCYEVKGNGEKAFREYQKLIEKYPKYTGYDEVVRRQFGIANLYLAGKCFRFIGLIPLYRSMDKTATMYEKIIKNGPYTDTAAQAQMKIGAAHENKRGLFKKAPDYYQAVKAYERAADRYNDRKQISADALYKAGDAYLHQTQSAEYDQNAAGLAIATFTDFRTLHKDDPRVSEAEKKIQLLKTEQARGNFMIAKFYEKRKKLEAARIYYNASVSPEDGDPFGPHAAESNKRLEYLDQKLGQRAAPQTAPKTAPKLSDETPAPPPAPK